jgi:hypothetical protein
VPAPRALPLLLAGVVPGRAWISSPFPLLSKSQVSRTAADRDEQARTFRGPTRNCFAIWRSAKTSNSRIPAVE